VQEAGGKCTDYTGNPFSVYQYQMIASNGIIHDDLLRIIRGGEV
jgi:myo-inositol-1(or 4)-monophosphatase